MSKFIPASPTSLGTFLTCPRQFQAKYITKEVKFEPTAASEHGDRGHKALEARLRHGTPLPAEFVAAEPFALAVLGKGGDLYVEHKLPWTAAGQPSDWWGRYAGGIADWLVVKDDKAWLGDWKFGGYRDDPLQLHMLIIGVFAHFPHVKHVSAALVFMQTGAIFQVKSDRSEISPRTIASELARYEQAQEMNSYPPRPNGLCRKWCQVVACPFHGRGR